MKCQKQMFCFEEQKSKMMLKLSKISKIESEKTVSECSTETFEWSED
jgi:hypothetical protein